MVLDLRAAELHPQRVPADHQRDRERHGQPERDRAGALDHGPRPLDREHQRQHDAGHGRVDEHFLADEHLGADQQAEPGAGPHRSPAAGEQPQQRVDHQRREHREHQVVVAEPGVDHGRGEPVHRAAEAGRRDARPPPAQQQEQRGRRPGQAQRQHHGEAGLRPGQQRHRSQQDPGQQQGCVPHQVDALRRVQGGREQGRKAAVADRRRRIAHVPGEQVDVVRVAELHPARRVGPQPGGHRHRGEQVAAQDQPRCPAEAALGLPHGRRCLDGLGHVAHRRAAAPVLTGARCGYRRHARTFPTRSSGRPRRLIKNRPSREVSLVTARMAAGLQYASAERARAADGRGTGLWPDQR